MGAKPSTMKRTQSAAFGRLRIDSPRIVTPGSVKQSLTRRRELRAQQVGTGPAALIRPGSQSGLAETSPLLIQPHQQQVGRELGATENQFMATPESPALMVWIVPALCCAMAYALYNIFIKKGSSHINPVLGGVILQLVAALLGGCLLTFLILQETHKGGDVGNIVAFDKEGIFWAVLAGLAVGTAEIVSFLVSSMGVQAMQSIPVIIGGSVLFGTVIGALALHEDLSMRGWGGVVLISIGISLVGLDSEGEMH
ncbi:unnamed protein product [Cylindrotheca closterium]|uniref:EamA domain-containing protein n=1 Tax=Cylindrotheca closterium TaxID=2856 RepID=A0AAD2FJA7_9STRA|nr:unnamed protein product [Cylindrotheca closterium]